MLKKIIFSLILFALSSSLYGLDLSEVSKNALKKHKLILISVESQNCRYCEKMNNEVFFSNKYSKHIRKNYIQKIVFVEQENIPKKLSTKYYPTNFIVDPKNMAIVDEFVGYIKPLDFIGLLDLVYKEETSN